MVRLPAARISGHPGCVSTLKVALVADSFAPDFDHRARLARQLTDVLLAAGQRVSVLTASPGVETYRSADVQRIPGITRRGTLLRSALLDSQADIALVISPDEFGRKALKQTMRVGLPATVIEQRPLPGYLPDYYVDQVIARASRLLVTSRWVSKALEDRGIAAHVWRPGVDLTAFHPGLRDPALHRAWTKDGRAAVGYAGDFRRSLGVKRLAALGTIPFAQPVLIGHGPRKTWLKANLTTAPLTDPTTTGDLGTALASLDVLVHPGRQLTDAPDVRAAMACGVPVVVTTTGGAAEFVRHRHTGLHFDRRDPLGLAAAVSELVTDPGLRAQLAINAFSWSQAQGWDRQGAALIDDHLKAVVGRDPADRVQDVA